MRCFKISSLSDGTGNLQAMPSLEFIGPLMSLNSAIANERAKFAVCAFSNMLPREYAIMTYLLDPRTFDSFPRD